MDKKSILQILKDKIVVPEIQREYVWGDNGDNADIVKNFVLDINEKLSSPDEDFTLGFLYSYTHSGELHLIDGQQRMTTIVLLAFYCYCREECRNSEVLSLLKNFSYRVRTDTEDFLFSLFSDAERFAQDLSLFDAKNLMDSKFYRSIYAGDKTITSMVKCLDTIHKLDDDNFQLTSGRILNHISFWTFEVGQTSQGEQLYISMNSRGEALTSSELFKPRLLEMGKDLTSKYYPSWGKAWDEWEESLFSYKGESMPNSVSGAMDTFLRCVIEIVSGEPRRDINPSEDTSVVNLNIIEDYFHALRLVYENGEMSAEVGSLYNPSASNLVLKILLSAVYQGESTEEVQRIFPIIKNWDRRDLLKNKELLVLLHSYHNQRELGWLDFVLSQGKEARQIDGVLDDHEWNKIKLYQAQTDIVIRDKMADRFHEAEKNHNLNGNIRAIWDVAFEDDFRWTEESLDTFYERYKLYLELFKDEHITTMLSKKPGGEIDNNILTRALLSIEPYGILVSGHNFAYGWKSTDGRTNYWRDISSRREGSKVISDLIDRLLEDNEHNLLYDKLISIVDSAKTKYTRDNALYYILNYPMALRAWNHGHNVLSFDDINEGRWENFNIWVVTKDDARSYYYNMFCTLLLFSLENEGKGLYKRLDQPAIIFECGLELKCSWRRGWDVVYKDWGGDVEDLKSSFLNEFGEFAIIDDDNTRKIQCFYFPKPSDVDQIELGKKVFTYISNTFNK